MQIVGLPMWWLICLEVNITKTLHIQYMEILLDAKIENFIGNQRTNGPVNAHLRSAVYTNVIENSPSIGADEALGPFFFRIINILSIQVFPFK